MAIRPGNLTEDPSDYTEFANSMAERIEDELNDLLQMDGLPRLPDGNDREVRDRRRLFIAIARAVVHHLDAKKSAITVEHPEGGSDTSPEFEIDWGEDGD